MMVKKEENKTSVEKLRDELFEVRVDVKAYLRNFKVLTTSVIIVIAVITFFGYEKIDDIQDVILLEANKRLLKTDSLLATIDQNKLDSLKKVILFKQNEYENVIKGIDNTIIKSKQLENKLIEVLSFNKSVNYNLSSYYTESPKDYFSIRGILERYKKNESNEIVLIFNDDIDLSIAKCIFLSITFVENKKIHSVKHVFYDIQGKYNKIPLTLDIAPKDYILEIGFIKHDEKGDCFYRKKESISVY